MKRVYTDPRFPEFEVHNEGDNTFQVIQRTGGEQHVIDTFRTYSNHPNKLIPEEVAAARARDYFKRMSEVRGMSAEFAQREQDDARMSEFDVPIQHASKPAPPGDPFGLSASKSLDQIMGDNVMSADDVISAYEAAKQMPDGPEKDQALERVKSMAGQMESSAEELVRNLLE